MREVAGDGEGEGETKTLDTRSMQEMESSAKAGS